MVLSDWIFTKIKTGLYQEMSENTSLLQEKFLPKIFFKIYLPNILSKQKFHQQILKRNLHKKKISEEKSLPNKIQIEIPANKYLTTQFPPKLSNENSLPNNT